MENLVQRLREEAARDDLAYRTVTVLMDAALKIEQLEAEVTALEHCNDSLIAAVQP